MAKRKFTREQQKATFRALAEWIASDDGRLKAFIKDLKPAKKKKARRVRGETSKP